MVISLKKIAIILKNRIPLKMQLALLLSPSLPSHNEESQWDLCDNVADARGGKGQSKSQSLPGLHQFCYANCKEKKHNLFLWVKSADVT